MTTKNQRRNSAIFSAAAESIAAAADKVGSSYSLVFSCIAISKAIAEETGQLYCRYNSVPACIAYADVFAPWASPNPFEVLLQAIKDAATEGDERQHLRVMLLLFAGEFFLTEEPEVFL